jgi:hypothetical protein
LLRGQRLHGGTVTFNAALLSKLLAGEYIDLRFFQHLAKDLLCYMGFEQPRNILAEAGHLVIAARAQVKLECVSADHLTFADVGEAKPARYHAAQMRGWFYQSHGQALASRRYRSNHSTCCAAVHHYIQLVVRRFQQRTTQEEENRKFHRHVKDLPE